MELAVVATTTDDAEAGTVAVSFERYCRSLNEYTLLE